MAHRYNRWTEYEDNILTQLVAKHGVGHWSTIAREMKSNYEISKRTGKQCRERWFNQLDQSNSNRKWTRSEDLQLIQFQAILGTKWIEISQHFPGRSDNNVKNHFYSILRKSVRKMCRFVNIKTTSMKVYSIKPSTLSRVFALGGCESVQGKQEQAQGVEGGLNSRFTKQRYSEITQIIQYFVFDNNAALFSQPPTKDKVKETLNNLMEINSYLQKESGSDVNSPESFSESDRKDSPPSKNESSEREASDMDLQSMQQAGQEMKEQKQEYICEQIEEEQFNSCGIFSQKPHKRDESKNSQIPMLFPAMRSLAELTQQKEMLHPQISSLSLIRGSSQLSINQKYLEINWRGECMNQEDDFQSGSSLRLYMTSRKSGDSLFNKFLQ